MKQYEVEKKANGLPLQKMGIGLSLAIFGVGSIALILETRFFIPALSVLTGQELIISWFLVAALGIFLPLLITAVLILKKKKLFLSQDVGAIDCVFAV